MNSLTIIALLALADVSSATSEQPSDDVFNFIAEEQQVVETASRRPQGLDEAPGSVTIISQEQIKRFGYQTMTQLLRSAGLYITENYDNNLSVGIRGSSLRSRYDKSIVWAIDGHVLNEDWTRNGWIFNMGFGVPLGDIERVEILRGPASMVWGTNGVEAVVNVITTRRGFSGAAGEVMGGNFGLFSATTRAQLVESKDLSFTASARYARKGAEPTRFADAAGSPCIQGVESSCLAGFLPKGAMNTETLEAYAKLDYGSFHLQAGYFLHQWTSFTGPYKSIFGYQFPLVFDRAFAEARFEKRLADSFVLKLKLGADRFGYRGTAGYDTDGTAAGIYEFSNYGRANSLNGEARLSFERSFSDVSLHAEAGGSIRFALTNSGGEDTSGSARYDIPTEELTGSAYASVDVGLWKKLTLSAGLRFDKSSLFVGSLSPRAGVIFKLDDNHVFKLLYARGFRNPSVFEAFYTDSLSIVPNPRLRPENSDTVELIFRRNFANRLTVQGSLFASLFRNIVVQHSGCYDFAAGGSFRETNDPASCAVNESLGNQPTNADSRDSFGGELFAQLSFKQWVGYLSSTLQQSRINGSQTPENSPQLIAVAGIGMPIGDHLTIGIEGFVISERISVRGENTRLPTMATLDVTLAALKLADHIDVRARLDNVFDSRIDGAAVGDEVFPLRRLPQGGRTIYVSLGGQL